jgi:histidine phosphotransferase ChpT
MTQDLRMAELLCTRLCHDLTGPIGAVNNGAEFLSEEGFNMQNQAVDLIVSSAFSAVTRLQFYRMAYGNMKDHGEANLSEKQKIAMDFFIGSKITLDWPDTHTESANVSISLKMARLIFNMLIVASATLIRGGSISVRLQQDEQMQKIILITAQGAGLKWDAEIEKVFSGAASAGELSPKSVQLHLTKRFSDELRATIEWRATENEISLKITQPPGDQ